VHGDIIIKGASGHAGYIFGSQNAIHRAIVFLDKLLEFIGVRSQKISSLNNPPNLPIPKVWGRFSITWIVTSNRTYNVVPGEVRIGFDMRLIPEEDPDRAISELRSFFEMTKYRTSIDQAYLEIKRAYAGYSTDPNHPFVIHAKKTLDNIINKPIPIIGMLGGNDGGWFRSYNIPIISYGVWDKYSNIHGPDESVDLEKIDILKEFLINIAREAYT